MQQAGDSELIAGMKQRLRQLQDRRRQLLNSRRLEEEELAFREPITAQIADVMRDRQLARVRTMIRRNMESVDRDIQDAVRRLGAAMLDADDDDHSNGLLNVKGCYPDLIPFAAADDDVVAPPPPPSTSAKGVAGQQQQKTLPPPASPSRKVLLEAVKEVLGKRISTNKTGTRPEETEATVPLPTFAPTPTTSGRVGLFRFQHDEGTDIKEETTYDKLSRFVCQRMPSVSVEAGNINSRHRLVTIPARQQISVAVFEAQSSSSASSRPTTPETEKAVDLKSIKNELPPSLPLLPAKLNDIVEPDELAQMVCDLLSDQVHLAFDSFTANGAIVERDDRVVGNLDDGPLAIDNYTQTVVRSCRDAWTVTDDTKPTLHNQAVGRDWISTETESSVSDEDEEEEERPLTPPRSGLRIVPDQTPPPDPASWRRFYPPSPPSSESPSALQPLLINKDDARVTVAASVVAVEQSSNSSNSVVGNSYSSGSDATGLVASSTLLTTTDSTTTSSSSTSTNDDVSVSVGGVGVSWLLSEGEVPNRVASIGGPVLDHPDVLVSSCDVDLSCSLSEGQVIISHQPIELSSTPLDGSSEGQIILPNDQRSNSTASFRSAAGSPGQIHHPSTDDDFMSQ